MISQPLKIHGGKGAQCGKLAKWVIAKMPDHTHYVEPFFGGGSVLLRKPTGASEVANDLDGGLINFWRVLQNPKTFAAFQRIVWACPLSEELFRRAKLPGGFGWSDAEQAAAFFVQCRQSRQGLREDFATLSRTRTRGGINEQASAWLSAVDGLPDAHRRLRGVVVTNRLAVELIKSQDGPHTLFYCDPPYLHSTRSTVGEYAHEMTEADHRDLLHCLSSIAGKFLLSGYPSELYEEFASELGWTSIDHPTPNHSASGDAKEIRTERLWANFDLR